MNTIILNKMNKIFDRTNLVINNFKTNELFQSKILKLWETCVTSLAVLLTLFLLVVTHFMI